LLTSATLPVHARDDGSIEKFVIQRGEFIRAQAALDLLRIRAGDRGVMSLFLCSANSAGGIRRRMGQHDAAVTRCFVAKSEEKREPASDTESNQRDRDRRPRSKRLSFAHAVGRQQNSRNPLFSCSYRAPMRSGADRRATNILQCGSTMRPKTVMFLIDQASPADLLRLLLFRPAWT
jgi:hypothetical protein